MENVSTIMKSFIPQPCPFPLIRIGGTSDGAYLIPNDLDGITACFSPGVCNTKYFEDELALKHGIPSHMCDFSSDRHLLKTPLIEGMQTFEKKWLDLQRTGTSITLANWVKKAEPEAQGDLMLQMDIEGAEYRNLVFAPEACLKMFRIIVVEIHHLEVFESTPTKFSAKVGFKNIARRLIGEICLPAWRRIDFYYPKTDVAEKLIKGLSYKLLPYFIEEFARKISRTHLCVHAHPNNCCGEFTDKTTGMNIPRVLELTFLRKDRFKVSKNDLILPKIPHPLDVVNVPTNAPLVLNSSWTP